MDSHQKTGLRYGVRREVLAQIALRYQQATGAQNTDRAVELTGYGRKYVITLLNHVPLHASQTVRPRLPIYGSAVQEALFLAWRTIQYPCAKRLVPCLPELIPLLERDGHLQLGEEHRRQLLAMSVRTAERLLSTQRRPTPHGFSTTKPGTLLKHQVPIRTFEQWDDHRPGFLEADLVAHCGGNVFGGYLYTLTLTDIATGWTECVPMLNRSPETVVAAIRRARQLFPFLCRAWTPIMGASFSMPSCSRIASTNGSPLPAAARTARTIMRMWSKRIGPSCARSSGMIGW